MLLNDLYRIEEIKSDDHEINAVISLNEHHHIFKGHFPDMPVLPGVCQAEICTELVNFVTAKSLILSEAPSIKFLQFVTPGNTRELNVKISTKDNGSSVDISASFFSCERTFLKLQGKLTSTLS